MTANAEIRRPMKAGEYIPGYHDRYFPFFAQPKMDGWRGVIRRSTALTNTMKPFRNVDIQAWAKQHGDFLNSCDGEFIAGDDISEKNFRNSASVCSNTYGGPDFTFWVFDLCSPQHRTLPYVERYKMIQAGMKAWEQMNPNDTRLRIVPSQLVHNPEELLAVEEHWLMKGCEGVMLHHPSHPYKDGRSTEKEGYLLKVKRFKDVEATIIGWALKQVNQNAPFRDETGMQKRSLHQAGKVEVEQMGSLNVRYDDGNEGWVGSGFDEATRLELFARRESLVGKRVTIKLPLSQGGYDSTRQPVYKGIRDPLDGG